MPMPRYRIELQDEWEEVLETHFYEGDEMDARQRTMDLAQGKDAARCFLYNAETGRELYGNIRKRIR